MTEQYPFKWRHFQADLILLCVRWYLRYPLSYRDLEEMMLERGLQVDHTTIYRWVQHYAPELEKRCRLEWPPKKDREGPSHAQCLSHSSCNTTNPWTRSHSGVLSVRKQALKEGVPTVVHVLANVSTPDATKELLHCNH